MERGRGRSARYNNSTQIFFHRDSFDAPATFAQNLPTLLPWYALDGLHRANAITQRARVIIGFALWPVCATFLLKIGGGESVDLAQSSRCLRMRRGGRCTGVRRHGRATFARHCTGFRVSGPFYRESRGAFGVHPRLKRSFFT